MTDPNSYQSPGVEPRSPESIETARRHLREIGLWLLILLVAVPMFAAVATILFFVARWYLILTV